MAKDFSSQEKHLLEIVQSTAISPEAAHKRVASFREELKASHSEWAEAQLSEAVAEKVIERYAKWAGMVGGTSALAGVIPGIGTIAALTGGAAADAATCMKLQVDMTLCIAAAYNFDLSDEEARQMAFLVAAGAALENFGDDAATKIASEDGVTQVRRYLKGTARQALKELFKKLGVSFARTALQKALPFGIGVVFGGSANFALTKYVGAQAMEFYVIDAAMSARQ